MKLKYNRNLNLEYYKIKSYNIAFYEYSKFGKPHGNYKGKLFGLRYWIIFNMVKNFPSGIKVNY